MEASELRRIIRQTLREFPWYESALREQGCLRARDEDVPLAELPLMTSERLEKHYYTPNQPLGRRPDLRCYRTSGTSSGLRKAIYYSENDERAYAEIKSRMFAWFLAGTGVRSALSDMGTGHAADTAAGIFARIGLQAESISFRLPVEKHLERLEKLRPNVLYTMPSILDNLLRAADDPLRFRIRKVILVGEAAAPAWIAGAAERLGIRETDVMDTYGSIEIGTIASYSHEHGRYVIAEGLGAEGLRTIPMPARGEPASLADDESILTLTSSVRETFPAVRYVTYDVVRDLRPIRVDGALRQSFQALVRRIGPELKHGEKISVYDIEDVVYRHAGQAIVRIEVAGGKLRVHVGGGIGAEKLAAIGADLRERIPEIGRMVEGGLLEELQVLALDEDSLAEESSIKHKKIYYS
ncbi:CoF synthetase [Cohnella fermenti]|uniref:CoF synthetase n=1 Tax=Cohnella fermenti TaxID=2565925 RepID=A0A4S4C3V2_9BACL|nr:CoF synthetase [Cohnella fermenti]